MSYIAPLNIVSSPENTSIWNQILAM